MLEDFSPEELGKLTRTLRSLHGSLNWADPIFSPKKNVFMSTLAQVAYGAIGADEHTRSARAGIVPSDAYQSLVRGPHFDFVEVARGGEFERVIIVRTPFFVAVIIQVALDIFIGVRGTVFAYDWAINLDTRRHYGLGDRYEGFLHRGFYREGLILSHLIEQKLETMGVTHQHRIHLAGHSLGGAVAGVLAMRGFQSHNHHYWSEGATDTYTYGAPRIGSFRAVRDSVVYAVRREHDLVPYTPPKWLGYADFLLEFDTDGIPFVRPRGKLAHAGRWLTHVRKFRLIQEHKIETYIREIQGIGDNRLR